MVDIETVWEEYWLRLMDGLDGVRGEEMRRASGSAMDVVLRRGSDLICRRVCMMNRMRRCFARLPRLEVRTVMLSMISFFSTEIAG